MVRMGLETFGGLGGDAFLMARQENLETIHRHNVVAERHGLLAEIGRELAEGAGAARHVTLREWLEQPIPPG